MPHSITVEQKRALFEAACQAQKRAYLLPHNTYRGGAAVLTKEGLIFTGCNIENAAHTPTVCAERLALFKAYSEGYHNFIAILYVADECGTACGVCRQVIAELAPDAVLIFTDIHQKKEIITSIDELLPLCWVNPTIGKK